MSNYSRHFDDATGGGDSHGGRGYHSERGGRSLTRPGRGGGGRYQSAHGGNVDSRGNRKPVVRKAIDYNALLMNHLAEQPFMRDYRDRPTLEPTADSIRRLPGVIDDVSHNPALGLCTRYVSLAVNKNRAAITALSWMPEGRRLVTASHIGEFTQWNGLQFNFEGIVENAHADPVRAMTWTHNDLLMLTGDEGGVVKYWQSTMNNIKAFKAHKEPVRDISCAPNDIHFVTASDDQTASIWDLETSTEVVCFKGHGYDIKAAKWHPTKGLILTGSKDQLIKIWDPRAGTGGMNHGRNEHCLADIHAHKNTVNRLAWSPLNPYWFASGSRDNLVKVFDLRTMRDFQTGRAHKKEITALTWHPTNERLFASGSYDGCVHQWFVGETESQAEITGAHDSAVYGLQWHPLGHLLATASNDQTTRFWARNRPGDDMTDKYNVASLPAEQKAAAVSTLVEAAKMNPSKYGRLPAALAEFASAAATEREEATAARSTYSTDGAGADVIPGMGTVKRESQSQPPPDVKPPIYSASQLPPSSSSSHRSSERRRSRSRERDERPGYNSSSSSHHSSSSRYPPSSSSAGPPQSTGHNAFFPSNPPPPPMPMPPSSHAHGHSNPHYPSAMPVPVPLSFAPSSGPSGAPPSRYAPPPQQHHTGFVSSSYAPPPQPQPYGHPPGPPQPYGGYPQPPPPQQHRYPPPPPPPQPMHYQR